MWGKTRIYGDVQKGGREEVGLLLEEIEIKKVAS